MLISAAPSLREQVADRLRGAIVDGLFKPGQRLIERELCEMLGVSRTSLREALRELETEGLISTQPNKGPSVAVIDLKSARDIYETREALEALAAKLFAQRATQSQIARLHESIVQMERVIGENDPAKFLAEKREFYVVLLEGADNQVITMSLRAIHIRASQLRFVSLSSPGRAETSVGELRRLLDALMARDADRAAALCAEHVRKASQAALSTLAATAEA